MPVSRCGECGCVFTSTTAFDEHRVGSFAERTRHCLTSEGMQAKGLVQNEKNWWSLPLSGENVPWHCLEQTILTP
jgi:D-alanyl-D-alanine dipeptidase